MTTFLKIAMGLVLALGLTGCYSNHSPKAVVSSVGRALKKNDFEVYQALLSQKALAEIGSAKHFKKFQTMVLKAEGKASLRSFKVTDIGEYRTGRYTTHLVTISLDSKAVAQAGVSCLARRVWEQVQVCSGGGRKDRGGGGCRMEMRPTIKTKCLMDSITY